MKTGSKKVESMKTLVRIFNHRSYPVYSVLFLGGLIYFLARNGVDGLDLIILSALMIVLFAVRQMFNSTQSVELSSRELLEQSIRGAGRPTIVEFFSSYCVGCMAVKPAVDRLERDAGDRIQIIRLNIDREPGKDLLDEYGVVFTPTFVYFDASGNRLRETVGVLDYARVLYELEQPR